ncbi:MAG: methyl-accepting chemotaxis protein [Burkholderiaceae bacterium]
MNAFYNLRIGSRLGLVLGSVLLMMAAMVASGVWGLNSLHGMTRETLEQDVALAQHAADLQILVLQERRFEKDAFINLADADKRDGYVKKWKDAGAKLQDALAAIAKLRLPTQDQQAVAKVGDSFKAYGAGFVATVAAIQGGQINSTQDANAAMGQYKEAVHGMEKTVDAINDRAMLRASGVVDHLDAVSNRAASMQIGLAVAAMLLAAGSCWLVTRSITVPLREAVRVAETVAAGDLGTRIQARYRDETGQLLASLERMNASLVRIVGDVRHASESIATGSTQIANGNADLSQRTEEQASNLQQTAASMEELTATVKHNADTARHATQLAASASVAAEQGGTVVGEVVQTMEDISASSKKIADIIGVIDGIAFQTNILALNAAVEAARAGEQGRGFAVVAGEVRTLAQRSAQAAKEIKTLIGESVEKVENGTRLVGDAGRTMDDIVSQVKRVSGLIGEISGSSVEQSSGIDQIGQSVNQLDQVTQQNAALVEESAAAAESLKHQAGRLAEMVAVFKLAA